MSQNVIAINRVEYLSTQNQLDINGRVFSYEGNIQKGIYPIGVAFIKQSLDSIISRFPELARKVEITDFMRNVLCGTVLQPNLPENYTAPFEKFSPSAEVADYDNSVADSQCNLVVCRK